VLDTFDNPKTLDRTAASLAYGSGCWRMNLEDVSIANYLMLGSLLEIDGATAAAGSEIDKLPMVWKRTNGDTYTAMLRITDIVDNLSEEWEDDHIQVNLMLALDLFTFFDDPWSYPAGLFINASLVWDEGSEQTNYWINVSVFDGGSEPVVAAEIDIGHFDDVPYVGFIKTGDVVTPFFSVDDGVTKWFFDIGGSAGIDMSQYFGGADALDIGIAVTASEDLSVATVFIDALDVVGDVSFVAE